MNSKFATQVFHQPWKCLIIDDFLPPKILKKVIIEESKIKKYFAVKNHPWKIKYRKMTSSSPELPPHHDYVNSDQDVVMIIYLNKYWKNKEHGELVLMPSKKENKDLQVCVEPIFNRAVLFQTSKKNIHKVNKFIGKERLSLICEWIPEKV